jgi:hypothetical protein
MKMKRCSKHQLYPRRSTQSVFVAHENTKMPLTCAEMKGLPHTCLVLLIVPYFEIRAGCFVRGSVVVKALCYKPQGRWFETRWGELISSIHLFLSAALGPGFTQPLAKMSTRIRKIMFLENKARPVRSAVREPIVQTMREP